LLRWHRGLFTLFWRRRSRRTHRSRGLGAEVVELIRAMANANALRERRLREAVLARTAVHVARRRRRGAGVIRLVCRRLSRRWRRTVPVSDVGPGVIPRRTPTRSGPPALPHHAPERLSRPLRPRPPAPSTGHLARQ